MEGQQTVEEVFNELKGRRLGLVKALTTDVQKFYQLCDPEKEESLCLYGLPDERWEVILPVEEVPPELPEPALGINFTRDGMQETDWLSLVAFHSDSWLISIASYLGARSRFGKKERKRLFQMMNNLHTVFEVVSGKVENQKSEAEIQHHGNKRKSKSEAEIQHNGNKSKSRSEAEIQHNGNKSKSTQIYYTGQSLPSGLKMIQQPEYEDLNGEEENDDDKQETSICGACGDYYANDQFWICCDICEKWFHGKCVKMTPSKAKNIKHYKCPYCRIKRGRSRIQA